MGKLMKRAEKFARSPKAKTLEKKMLAKLRTRRPGKKARSDSRSFARRPSVRDTVVFGRLISLLVGWDGGVDVESAG